ncbi:hypothetical protein [Nocardia transvalensis]|uniref:hypothetical protein n=1 Tax=Nocardia transvalensis TaxID=37333 RepID=UPI001894223D|nr:hypothetical protein [Nocardia transvalensis]MBF6328858.1 hypothetical protein [Nocardia transvalensis]
MTTPAADGRKVVQLFAPRGSARHAARHRLATARTWSPAERPPQLTLVRTGTRRHAAAARPAARRAHAAPDRYDRIMMWAVGCLLRLRIALVGENTVSTR